MKKTLLSLLVAALLLNNFEPLVVLASDIFEDVSNTTSETSNNNTTTEITEGISNTSIENNDTTAKTSTQENTILNDNNSSTDNLNNVSSEVSDIISTENEKDKKIESSSSDTDTNQKKSDTVIEDKTNDKSSEPTSINKSKENDSKNTSKEYKINTFDKITDNTLKRIVEGTEEKIETIQMAENVKPKGNIEVETHLVLPIRNTEKNNIKFKIYDANNKNASIDFNDISKDGYYEKSIKLGSQNIRVVTTKRDKDGHLLSGIDNQNNIVYFSVNLYSLDKGTYTIELSGKNFVTYKTNVTLEDFSKRISITNEKGMFEIGDINSDGKVDEKDINLMIESIDNNKSNDLNLDGTTDIADLNYITAITNGTKKEAKFDNTSAIIDNNNVSFDIQKNSVVSGDLNNIFTEDGVVTLKSANGLEVTEENPINLSIDLGGDNKDSVIEMSEIRIGTGENMPKNLKVRVEKEDGTFEIFTPNAPNPASEGTYKFTEEAGEDTIVIDLKGQIAVKKVTIIITETSSNNLADIAKVEFLNNVKVKTKMPDEFYTPKNLKVDTSKSEQLTVSFQNVENVTGYEIKIVGPKMENGTIFQTTYNTFTIEDLKNYATYKISVQSVNQEWRSGWSDAVEASPQATRKPPAPDMVVATPTYSGIDFRWNDMDDTKTYNIYYREVGTEEWLNIKDIAKNSYSLKGLKASVEYEAYITGNNDLGEGAQSQTVKAKTKKADATITPKYKLINDYNEETKITNHIKDVLYSTGEMKVGDKFSMVDDNYLSYWEIASWNVGSHYYNIGYPITVLDKAYTMDEFVFTVPDSYQYNYKSGTYDQNASNKNDTLVYYWKGETNRTEQNKTTVQGVLTTKTDENGRKYYVLKLKDPIEADAIQLGLTVAGNGPLAQIAELKFYEYDSLVDDVAKLFVDDLRIELQKDVTQEKIDELRKRANTKDNGEYSPYRDSVLADLDYAEKILKDEKINDIITLNPNISNSYNGHLGFAMTISDYQPLGIVARPGDTLTVYVGSTGNVNAEIVYTQFYAEANTWSKTSQKLQKGQNIINVEKIGSAEAERGGSVYIRYTSKPDEKNPIKVRVSGGHKIPMLDTTLLKTEAEKKEAISNYVKELEDFNAKLKGVYSKEDKTFDEKTSVLGSTEIVTRHGLFSVSSIAVENALNSVAKSNEEKTNRLYESTEAFNEMMEMFYRHKGLSENAEDPKNEMPKARINIRYMRMFDGAFMYAGGYHVGIEYGSIAGLIQASRNSDDATGYFGWGISHEVGHQINQSNTVFAEVTNNIYSMLAQTSNDKDKSRLESSEIYKEIYNKVTSHTLGRSQNVFVQLGMYWQLHLAYDDNKTFSDTNSIYSRINQISRTYVNSKKYTRDDLTILFACRAANKNLLDFFEKWGLIPSDEMKAEIEALNLEKETKAIYYLNDSARRYRLNTNQALDKDTKVNASITESNSQEKRVVLSFDVTNDKDKILGYEIIRNGESIAFVEGNTNTYTDNVGAENNRAYTYEVIAYDYLLNKTENAILDEVKISHNGSVLKDTFTIESNVKAKDEIVNHEDENMDYSKLSVNKLIDGKDTTYFNGTEKIKSLVQNGNTVGTSTDNGNAYVIINLNDKLSVSGIQYKAATKDNKPIANTIEKYKIYVSSNKEDWTEVKSGTFNLTSENDYTDLVYFMKEGTTSKTQLWTYNDISYIKIESVNNKNGLSGAEFDVIAPPGDNIDISTTQDNKPTIGKLESDYCYLTSGCTEKDENGDTIGLIKKGSVIIKGSYRGSPSFNIVGIGDAQDATKLYSGYQLIFAEVNDDMTVYEVASGTWMYVMTQEEYEKMINSSSNIRAYLYRVNDANTLEGQRLTSTSTKVTNLAKYNDLNYISITSSDINK